MKNSLLVLSIIVLAGCQTVQPWERGILAKEEMQWQASAMETRFRQQMFNSKEASSGANGAAGGGCGCN